MVIPWVAAAVPLTAAIPCAPAALPEEHADQLERCSVGHPALPKHESVQPKFSRN